MVKEKKNFVWIASYPKSGNTWFRIFLENLLLKSVVPININEINSSTIASDRNYFDAFSGTNSSDLSFREIDNLRPLIYKSISSENEELQFMKVHDMWHLNSENKPIFPPEITKGVIYIVRNPLDIVVSLANHNNKSIPSTIDGLNNKSHALCSANDKQYIQLRQKLSDWSTHVNSWIFESKLPNHIVKYEDLIDNTIVTFRDSIRFLGLDFTQQQVLNAINNSQFEELREQELKFGFKERPSNITSFFRKGEKEDWRNVLTKQQVQKIVNVHEELMRKLDYLV